MIDNLLNCSNQTSRLEALLLVHDVEQGKAGAESPNVLADDVVETPLQIVGAP
jgi:hypothetical protein